MAPPVCLPVRLPGEINPQRRTDVETTDGAAAADDTTRANLEQVVTVIVAQYASVLYTGRHSFIHLLFEEVKLCLTIY